MSRADAKPVVLITVERDLDVYKALGRSSLYDDNIDLKITAFRAPREGEDLEWEDVKDRLAGAACVLLSLSGAFLSSWFMRPKNREALAAELSAMRRRGVPVYLVLTEAVPAPASLRAFEIINGRFFGPVRKMSEGDRRAFFIMVRQEIASKTTRAKWSTRDEAFEEFKLLLESTQHLADQRQGAAQTYLAVTAGITAVIAFLIKDLSFRGWRLTIIGAPLFLAGLAACAIWRNVIRRYERRIDWRYRQLREIENQGLASGYRMINKEYAVLLRPRAGKGLSGLEVLIPWMFGALFLVGLIAAVALGFRNESAGPPADKQEDAQATPGAP